MPINPWSSVSLSVSPHGILVFILQGQAVLVSAMPWAAVEKIARKHGKASPTTLGKPTLCVSVNPVSILFVFSDQDTKHVFACYWHDLHKILPENLRAISIEDMDLMSFRTPEGPSLSTTLNTSFVSMDLIDINGKSTTSLLIKWDELAGIAKKNSKGTPLAIPDKVVVPQYGILDIHHDKLGISAFEPGKSFGCQMAWENIPVWVLRDGNTYFIDDKKNVFNEVLNANIDSLSRKFDFKNDGIRLP